MYNVVIQEQKYIVEEAKKIKLNFTYKDTKRVIKTEDFISQIEKFYNKKYFLQIIDMGEYETTVFVSDNHIKKIEYIGDDLIFYKVYSDNKAATTVSKAQLKGNTDYLEAKLIEDNSLVVLETKQYNYVPIIKEYYTYSENKSILFDTDADMDLLSQKLSNIWRTAVADVINYIDFEYTQDIYNGDIIISVENKKYKTTDKYIYAADNYLYVFIPEQSIALILNENNSFV